jgi:hypothetical protein
MGWGCAFFYPFVCPCGDRIIAHLAQFFYHPLFGVCCFDDVITGIFNYFN